MISVSMSAHLKLAPGRHAVARNSSGRGLKTQGALQGIIKADEEIKARIIDQISNLQSQSG